MKWTIVYALACLLFLVIMILSMLGVVNASDKRMEILIVVSFLLSIADFSNNGAIIAILCTKAERVRRANSKSFHVVRKICDLYTRNDITNEENTEDNLRKQFKFYQDVVNSRFTSLRSTYIFYKCRQDTVFGNIVIGISLIFTLALIFVNGLVEYISIYNEPMSTVPIILFFVNSYFHSMYHTFSEKYNSTIDKLQAENEASINRLNDAAQQLASLKGKRKVQAFDLPNMT